MIRRLINGSAFAVIASAAFLPSAWKFRSPLSVDAKQSIASVRLDSAVYRGARADLADLRVLHNGQEAPYILQQLSGKIERRQIAAEVLDKSVGAGGLGLTLDVGAAIPHNRVRIATAKSNFRERVGIETSNDRRHWSLVRGGAEIFDFTGASRKAFILSVDYPVSTRRYLRLTIPGWRDPDSITGASVQFHLESDPIRDTLATLAPRAAEDSASQSTLLLLDLGAPLTCGRLRFDIATPRFSRDAEVESSVDGITWQPVTRGVLVRLSSTQIPALEFYERRQRYLRVRIFNGDDRPLAVAHVSAEVIERRVEFEPAGSGAWWLYYGNPDAKAPHYDLADVLERPNSSETVAPAPGLEEINPEYRPSPPIVRPWTERHPALLYGTLAIAILGLGVASFRFLRRIAATSANHP
ncbi:MAG: DUF3999 family protein [Bryobacteraceae bacterium]